jgi:hypothetical protein
MYNEQIKSQGPTALSRTKFSTSIEPVQKALSRLEEAVEHIYSQFAPVIGPGKPTGCGNEKEAHQCDYEHFISSTCAKIHAACEMIDLACDRSVI